MSSQNFLCCIHSANQPQVRNRRYPSFVTTWTNIALAKFHHPEQFQSLIIPNHHHRFIKTAHVQSHLNHFAVSQKQLADHQA
jgi:hypothetical protein